MKSAAAEMPIFTKGFEFLSWLVPLSHHFPKQHRYTVTRRLTDAALDFVEYTLEANEYRGRSRVSRLTAADASLSKIRIYLRLAYRWKWINDGQYEHAARMVAELGRLLGGWKKAAGSGKELKNNQQVNRQLPV